MGEIKFTKCARCYIMRIEVSPYPSCEGCVDYSKWLDVRKHMGDQPLKELYKELGECITKPQYDTDTLVVIRKMIRGKIK